MWSVSSDRRPTNCSVSQARKACYWPAKEGTIRSPAAPATTGWSAGRGAARPPVALGVEGSLLVARGGRAALTGVAGGARGEARGREGGPAVPNPPPAERRK